MNIIRFNERINWRGEWIPEEGSHPLEKVSEYIQKQELTKELLAITKKYQGKIKDQTISDSLADIMKKYDRKIK